MQRFFLLFGLFYLFITLPFYYIYVDPSSFGLAMAIGFAIGHTLLFAAMTYTARLAFAINPRLADKERYVTVLRAVATAWILAVTTVTMVFGDYPVYDFSKHITDYRQAPIVALSIAVAAIFAWVPVSITILFNSFKSQGMARLRSILLSLGFLLLTAVGPLHGLAQNYTQFLIADFATILSIAMIGAGVANRTKPASERSR